MARKPFRLRCPLQVRGSDAGSVCDSGQNSDTGDGIPGGRGGLMSDGGLLNVRSELEKEAGFES